MAPACSLSTSLCYMEPYLHHPLYQVSSEPLLGFLGQTGLLPLPCEISYYSI